MTRDWDSWLKDASEQIDKDRIEKIKQSIEPVDSSPIFEKLLNCSKEEGDKIIASLTKSFDKVGQMLVERAILEEVMTEKEWKDIQQLGIGYSDISPILQAYYNKKDKTINETIKVLTTDNSPIYKNKAYLEKRFQITMISQTELMKEIEKEPEFQKFKKEWEAKNGTQKLCK